MSYQYTKQFKKILAETLVLAIMASNIFFGVAPVGAVSTEPIPSNGGYMQVITG